MADVPRRVVNLTPCCPAMVPLVLRLHPMSEKLVTVVPLIPLTVLLLIFMLLSDVPNVLVRLIPLVVLLLIVPPEPAVIPVPVTTRPPLLPVVLSTIAELALAVVEVMLLNFRLLAPIVVLATLTAVAVVVVIVLLIPVALTVPPPVAVKATLPAVLRMMSLVKLIVAPVLTLRMMPVPVPPLEVITPPSVIVPPVLF